MKVGKDIMEEWIFFWVIGLFRGISEEVKDYWQKES